MKSLGLAKITCAVSSLLAVLIISIVIPSIVFSHAGETIKSVDEVVAEILSKQNAATISQLDCTKIFDAEFEELGDAVMERMAGSHELHEQMDAMMGGEGSESLRAMHVTMGANWLGCGTGSFQGMMGGRMNGGMMPMMMRMMGNYYPAYFTGYDFLLAFAVVGWVLFAVLLALLVLVLAGKIKIQRIKK